MQPKLKIHPNSPKGRAGREATRRARMDADSAWCNATHTQNDRARRTIDSGKYRAQVAGECYSDWLADQARAWRGKAKHRGQRLVGIDRPTVAAKGKSMMRVTFVKPCAFGFQYGYMEPHPSGNVRLDKHVFVGTVPTEAEARSLAGRLV